MTTKQINKIYEFMRLATPYETITKTEIKNTDINGVIEYLKDCIENDYYSKEASELLNIL